MLGKARLLADLDIDPRSRDNRSGALFCRPCLDWSQRRPDIAGQVGLGRQDGVAAVSRTDALANAADIVAATDLPVSADLENGYGPTPEDCATTVRMAAAAGLCGCTIALR